MSVSPASHLQALAIYGRGSIAAIVSIVLLDSFMMPFYRQHILAGNIVCLLLILLLVAVRTGKKHHERRQNRPGRALSCLLAIGFTMINVAAGFVLVISVKSSLASEVNMVQAGRISFGWDDRSGGPLAYQALSSLLAILALVTNWLGFNAGFTQAQKRAQQQLAAKQAQFS